MQLTTAIDNLNNMESFRLSNEAGVIQAPHGATLGARFLFRLRDGLVESIVEQGGTEDDPESASNLYRALHHNEPTALDCGGDFGEIIATALPVSNHDRWLIFADLCAWTFENTEVPDDASMDYSRDDCLWNLGLALLNRLAELFVADALAENAPAGS